jgi:four helix bundle protein
VKDYRELKVWQRSHVFALTIYRVTAKFRAHELYGLPGQMRRASTSIATNIAGCGSGGDPELRRFLSIALGSAYELDDQILLATDLGYISGEQSSPLGAEILELRKMLGGFIQKLKG